MTDHAPHEAGKALHLLDRKEMGWLQASYCRIQLNIDDGSEGSDVVR